ncbi:hypothetical protein LUZ61_012639 [Rhynchospora tenuis]|uniref:PHD finger protein ALFIN-LIKE n=1 Tax=Rhynchospora tenuis TaxID=198213 RepID=A0AAD6A399_9POAL|nr:hypothetical protein LUZ61_012639 [Rhynchospora tenuis]
MDGPANVTTTPRTVEEIFKDFRNRRTAIVRALTSDVEEFSNLCDPDKDNLCLYGLSNGTWEVTLPAEEVPTELPEPALGINFARDGMNRKDWLSLVAVHSDSWLLSVAFYYAARLNRNDRKRLFGMINDLPTVYEVVSGGPRQTKDRSSVDSGSKSKITKQSSDGQIENISRGAGHEGYGEDDGEHSETICGYCNGIYSADEFWICCDVCERWYHGKCVKITPAKADSIKQYKCPSCSSSKKPRQ